MKNRFPEFKQNQLNFTVKFIERSSRPRGGSRAAATPKMERFVTIVNGQKSLTIITKRSILDTVAILDPSLRPLSI